MTDYKRAYHILCAAASHALDVLPDTPENAAGRTVIQEALLEAECASRPWTKMKGVPKNEKLDLL